MDKDRLRPWLNAPMDWDEQRWGECARRSHMWGQIRSYFTGSASCVPWRRPAVWTSRQPEIDTLVRRCLTSEIDDVRPTGTTLELGDLTGFNSRDETRSKRRPSVTQWYVEHPSVSGQLPSTKTWRSSETSSSLCATSTCLHTTVLNELHPVTTNRGTSPASIFKEHPRHLDDAFHK